MFSKESIYEREDEISVESQMTNLPEEDGGVIKMNGVTINAKQGEKCFFCGSGDSLKQKMTFQYDTGFLFRRL